MALANFFSKNALAAAQVLGGMTHEALAATLGEHVIAIVFDETAAASQEGRTALELATNLAARLYPAIAILPLVPTSEASRDLSIRLVQLTRAINPDVEVVTEPARVTIALVAGDTAYPVRDNPTTVVLYFGSSNWHACISAAHPVGCGRSRNPFGAAAAACLVSANAFRTVFAANLPNPERDSGLALSMFDYRCHPAPQVGCEVPRGGPDLELFDLNLAETILGGVGAIGNATVWTLARVTGLHGALVLVDGERVELSNLQRYVLTTQEHAASTTLKVELAQSVLDAGLAQRSGSALTVLPHPLIWGEYLRQRAAYRFERVATAFDTIDARLAVQAALPRRIVNAWTQQGDLGVSRHYSFGHAPCMGCVYPRTPGGRSEAELVAEAMMVPEPAFEIRELLYSGSPVTEDFIRGVAGRRGVASNDDSERLLKFAGRPLREFHQEVFCGGLMMQIGGRADGSPVRAEAPIAFQSALAGVMLAAEIVIDAGGLRESGRDAPPTRTVIDLLRPLSVYEPQFSRRQDGHCLCEDADYLEVFNAKYGHSKGTHRVAPQGALQSE